MIGIDYFAIAKWSARFGDEGDRAWFSSSRKQKILRGVEVHAKKGTADRKAWQGNESEGTDDKEEGYDD